MAPAKLCRHIYHAPRRPKCLLQAQQLLAPFQLEIYAFILHFLFCHKKHARRFKQISKKDYNLYTKIQNKNKIEATKLKSMRQVELVRNFSVASRFACVDMTKAQICIHLHVIGQQSIVNSQQQSTVNASSGKDTKIPLRHRFLTCHCPR